MMTSASRIKRHISSLPSSERRSTPRLRWLRPLRRKKTLTPFRYASAPDQWRSHAPLGGSIFTTSAPRSARICTAEGPCRKCVKLRTFTPFNIVYPILSLGGQQSAANTSPIPYPHCRSREPRKTWLAFLEESPDPLGTVLRLEDVVTRLERQPDGLFAARPQRRPHAAFDGRHGLVHSHQPRKPQREGREESRNRLFDAAEFLLHPRKSIGKVWGVVKRSVCGLGCCSGGGRDASGHGLLAVSPKGGVGLFPAHAGQSGLGDDAPDLLPLRTGDASEWGTDVSLIDPAQDGQRLLHSVVPVEERLRVGRLHNGVGSAGHPAGFFEVATVHGREHLHVQVGYDATVPGEDTVGADAQRRQQRLAEAREQ